jgi:hypothetical protein
MKRLKPMRPEPCTRGEMAHSSRCGVRDYAKADVSHSHARLHSSAETIFQQLQQLLFPQRKKERPTASSE